MINQRSIYWDPWRATSRQIPAYFGRLLLGTERAYGPNMRKIYSLLGIAALAAPWGSGCEAVESSGEQDVVDIDHTDVERQYIGNCWLYAQASWVESMHKSATGTAFDVSQSYWTYWHWWDQIVFQQLGEIQTGGSEYVADKIVEWRGVVAEAEFIPEDGIEEGSQRQSSALAFINNELKSGRLSTEKARKNRKLVRTVLNEAWQLNPDVVKWMNKAFGTTGTKTFLSTARSSGTPIIQDEDFQVRFTHGTATGSPGVVDTSLKEAMEGWTSEYYPFGSEGQRNFQIRVQKALHDGNPVVMVWDVDFNAMEGGMNERRGSFNLTTLKESGSPGRQGGHMVVLEDYQIKTKNFGLLEAGVTLDPSKPEDKQKLDAALLPSSEMVFFRVKNSWGALRDDRASAPGFPGYHDLYMDYLNGPISWCPDVEGVKNPDNCRGESTPLSRVRMPVSY